MPIKPRMQFSEYNQERVFIIGDTGWFKAGINQARGIRFLYLFDILTGLGIIQSVKNLFANLRTNWR